MQSLYYGRFPEYVQNHLLTSLIDNGFWDSKNKSLIWRPKIYSKQVYSEIKSHTCRQPLYVVHFNHFRTSHAGINVFN